MRALSTAILMLTGAACLAAARPRLHLSPKSNYLNKPFGPVNRLLSPDGSQALWGDYDQSQLWLEDTRTHQRRMVRGITVPTMTLAWSPDSTKFAVNDRAASNVEEAYLYDAASLNSLDLADRLTKSDARAEKIFKAADHSYVHTLGWLDRDHVEVQLSGHTDGETAGGKFHPPDCFDFRYRVSINGEVQPLSALVARWSDPACKDL